MHLTTLTKKYIFLMQDEKRSKTGAVFKRSSHNVGIADRASIVRKGNSPRILQKSDFRNLFAFSSLRYRGNWQQSKLRTEPPRLIKKKFYYRWIIYRGVRVRHACNSTEAAINSRGYSAFYRFLVLASRLTQVCVRINERGHEPSSAHVDNLCAVIRYIT